MTRAATSETDRTLETTLREAGDPTGALLWRQLCQALDGPLTAVVAARLAADAERAAAAMAEAGWQVHAHALDPHDDDPTASLGLEEALLRAHAAVWATPVGAPMSRAEREALDVLRGAGAPSARAVVLLDADLVARLADDPAAELAEVRERLHAVLPADWPTRDDGAAWLGEQGGHREPLVAERRREVALYLLDDATRRAGLEREAAAQALAEVDAQLASEDAALDSARREGDRAAAHVVGTLRRRTEELLVDLRTFLRELDAELPEEIASVDLDTARRTLPHWLHHVVEQFLTVRLSDWRAAVLRDLADVRVAAEVMDHVELLAPFLHPAPVRGEAEWRRRLGITAALGGGAALAVFGLWLPALVAVAGGVAWSAIGRGAREERNRKHLIDAAQVAVRDMGRRAEEVLRDQIERYREQLAGLGASRQAATAEAQAEHRRALAARRDYHAGRADELDTRARRLDAARTEVQGHG